MVKQLFFQLYATLNCHISRVSSLYNLYLLDGLGIFILFFSCFKVFLNIGILKLQIIGLTRELHCRDLKL